MPAPAADTQRQVVVYVPRQTGRAEERDLLRLECQKWGSHCGVLTRLKLFQYLRDYFSSGLGTESDSAYVQCCGSGPIRLEIHAFPLRPGVSYRLLTTTGYLDPPELVTRREKQSVTFDLSDSAQLSRPATAVLAARPLSALWTTGGAEVSVPTFAVEGGTVRSPIPLFGSVELALEVQFFRHMLHIGEGDKIRLLLEGWSEFVVGLPDGGRPVALEIPEPPGAAETARGGGGDMCARGGGGTGSIKTDDDDDDDVPEAQGEDKHIDCDYCRLECEDEDES